MFDIIFFILMLVVFGKILGFALKAAWGISKIIVSIILLPLFLILLVLKGLLIIAFPVLIVVGLVSLFVLHD